MKKLLKITSVILIQAFMVADVGLLPGAVKTSNNMLSAQININVEQFKQAYSLACQGPQAGKEKAVADSLEALSKESAGKKDSGKSWKQDMLRTAWMFPLGDFFAQLIAGADISPYRLIYMAAIGAFYGFLWHFYLRKLDRRFPSKDEWLKKVMVDQFVFTPPFHILNFSLIALCEGNLSNLINTLEASYLSAHIVNWSFWLPVNSMNFRFVKPGYRVLFVNIINLIWVPLLSLLGHGELKLGSWSQVGVGLIAAVGVTALAGLLIILSKKISKKENANPPVETDEETKLVDGLVKEALAAKAPQELVADYIPGPISIVEGIYPDSLDAKIEAAQKHLMLAVSDPGLIKKTEAALFILKSHPSVPLLKHMQFEKIAHKIVKTITGIDDAYSSYKKKLDDMVLKIYPQLRRKITDMAGQEEGLTGERIAALKSALVYSAILNYLDLTHPKVLAKAAQDLGIKIDLTSEEEISTEILLAFVEGVYNKVMEQGLLVNDSDFLIDTMRTREGGKIIYLVDNHGEVILDMLVIEQLLAAGFPVTVGGKGETIRDDVTYEELNDIFKNNPYLVPFLNDGRLKIVSTGSDALGTDFTTADKSSEFVAEFKDAFMYLAKGAGNFILMFGQKFRIPGFHVLGFKNSDTVYDLFNDKRNSALEKMGYDLAVAKSPRQGIVLEEEKTRDAFESVKPRFLFFSEDGREVWLAGKIAAAEGKQKVIENKIPGSLIDSSSGFNVVRIEGDNRFFVIKHAVNQQLLNSQEFLLRDSAKRTLFGTRLLDLMLKREFPEYKVTIPEVLLLKDSASEQNFVLTEYIPGAVTLKQAWLRDDSSRMAEAENNELLDIFFGFLLFSQDREYLLKDGSLIPFDMETALAPLYYVKNGIANHSYNMNSFPLRGERGKYLTIARRIKSFIENPGNSEEIRKIAGQIWPDKEIVDFGKGGRLLAITPEIIVDFLRAQAAGIENAIERYMKHEARPADLSFLFAQKRDALSSRSEKNIPPQDSALEDVQTLGRQLSKLMDECIVQIEENERRFSAAMNASPQDVAAALSALEKIQHYSMLMTKDVNEKLKIAQAQRRQLLLTITHGGEIKACDIMNSNTAITGITSLLLFTINRIPSLKSVTDYSRVVCAELIRLKRISYLLANIKRLVNLEIKEKTLYDLEAMTQELAPSAHLLDDHLSVESSKLQETRLKEYLRTEKPREFFLSDILQRFEGLTREGALKILQDIKYELDEYLEVTDESGNPTGKLKQRKLAHQEGDWHRTVHILVLTRDGRILMQIRGKGAHSSVGKKDVSAAGHVAIGNYEDTAFSELSEEIGVQKKDIIGKLMIIGAENQFKKIGRDDSDEEKNTDALFEYKTSGFNRELSTLCFCVTSKSAEEINNWLRQQGERRPVEEVMEVDLAQELAQFALHPEDYTSTFRQYFGNPEIRQMILRLLTDNSRKNTQGKIGREQLEMLTAEEYVEQAI